MAGHSTHDRCVFVIYFSLDQPVAKKDVVFRGRDGGFPVMRRVESSLRQPKSGKDLTSAKPAKRLMNELFQRFTEENKADVAVLRPRARLGRKRDLERLA